MTRLFPASFGRLNDGLDGSRLDGRAVLLHHGSQCIRSSWPSHVLEADATPRLRRECVAFSDTLLLILHASIRGQDQPQVRGQHDMPRFCPTLDGLVQRPIGSRMPSPASRDKKTQDKGTRPENLETCLSLNSVGRDLDTAAQCTNAIP